MENLRMAEIFYRRTYLLARCHPPSLSSSATDRVTDRDRAVRPFLARVVCTCLLLAHECGGGGAGQARSSPGEDAGLSLMAFQRFCDFQQLDWCTFDPPSIDG